MRFRDSYFQIAHSLLCEPNKKWNSYDFQMFNRANVIDFFNFLIKENIVERKVPLGRTSFSTLKDPEKLLKLCISAFKDSENKVIYFTSRRTPQELLEGLKAIGGLDFYLGRFSGIRAPLKAVYDNTLSIILPDRSNFQGYNLQELSCALGINRIKSGGEITFIFPRYSGFLKDRAQEQNGCKIPSDFYTFLYLSCLNSMTAEPQINHTIEKLKGVNGTFLCWK